MTKNSLSTLLVSTALIAAAACGKKDSDSGASAAKATSGSAPSAASAPAPASAPPPAAVTDIDLAKAGPGWQGFHVKGPAGAEVSDNGTGGVVLNFPDSTMLQLTVDGTDMKQFKEVISKNAKSITFSVDKPDEIVWKTVDNLGGADITGYGFSVIVNAGGKKVTCGSSYDDEATAQRMQAICKSLAKG
jgi:hypothetical protein